MFDIRTSGNVQTLFSGIEDTHLKYIDKFSALQYYISFHKLDVREMKEIQIT